MRMIPVDRQLLQIILDFVKCSVPWEELKNTSI